MTKKFSVLFIVDATSRDDCSALQRFRVLKAGLERLGVKTGIMFMGEFPINSPRILLPVNMPLFLKTVRQYDVVHAAGLSIIAMGLAKPFGDFKLVVDIHGSTDEYRLTKKDSFDFKTNYQILASKMAFKIAKQRGDCYVTVSEPLRQNLVKQGFPEGKIEIICNGVDTQLFNPSTEESDDFTVTYAGAYQKWQGIENLVEAAYLLKGRNIKFKMLGFQKHDLILKEQIKARLKETVTLIDYQPRIEDKQPKSFLREMSRSNVLVIPRYWDPAEPLYSNPEYVRKTFGWLPTKFAEYAAMSKPIIVTSLDVSADFVKEYNCGFVCDPMPEAIAKTILKAQQTPKEELIKMGKNARIMAETYFDQKVTCQRYYDFVTQFL